MKLLDTYQLGSLRLPNRMVMAPMTRSRAPQTLIGDLASTYYAQRASAGLIVAEATQVHPSAQGYPDTPGIHTGDQVDAWRRVTEAVHDADGRIFLQLWHVGRISHPAYQGGKKPIAPSAVRPAGQAMTPDFRFEPFPKPRALETDEIPQVVGWFEHGAAMAKEAGFDGVEIHGANGYLIDQFLRSGTNRRTDAYGGSVVNRARFLLEVADAVAGAWSPDRVGVRLSPTGTASDMHDDDPEATFGYAAERLSERGLAYLHVVEGAPLGDQAVSAFMRQHYDGTLISAGGYDRATGEAALQEGRADLIGYARLFLANPDLPHRFADDAPLNEPNPKTFYGGGAEGYVDYPALEEVPA